MAKTYRVYARNIYLLKHIWLKHIGYMQETYRNITIIIQFKNRTI